MKSLLLVLTIIRNIEAMSLVRTVLDGAGHRIIESDGYEQAQLLLENGIHPDLLVVEGPSTGAYDLDPLHWFLSHVPAENVCLIVGMGHQALQEKASKRGVRHFLTKPITKGDFESIIDALQDPDMDQSSCLWTEPTATGSVAAVAANPADMPSVPYVEELGENGFFLAASPKMLEIHRQVKLLADADVNVLILGESGTGKEVIAHLIHKHSQRSREKFLKVNCAALPADLLESELFGHRQGAFTGAIKDRAGKFEQVNHGTLLLDEIGEMPVQMQAKLLHVLQDGQFTRLGGQECTKVDVRVLAATNVEIENALLERVFREDLYYRLSVYTIKVPPLRDRREEIPYLIEENIRRTPVELKRGFSGIFPSRLIDCALLYDWGGNLRELRNFVTRTIVMRDPDAAARELETKIAAMSEAHSRVDSGEALSHRSGMRSIVRDLKERTEVKMIQEALEVSGWNRRRAARALNISYRGLLYKIQRHQLIPGLPGGLREGIQKKLSARSIPN